MKGEWETWWSISLGIAGVGPKEQHSNVSGIFILLSHDAPDLGDVCSNIAEQLDCQHIDLWSS